MKRKEGILAVVILLSSLASVSAATNEVSSVPSIAPLGLRVKGFLEILSYVGTVVTALVAVIALRQLSLAQEQLKLAMHDI